MYKEGMYTQQQQQQQEQQQQEQEQQQQEQRQQEQQQRQQQLPTTWPLIASVARTMRPNGPNQAPRRKLIPNLFSSILRVVAESDRPLTQHEIVEAVSERLERSDEELKRQVTVNLHDALIYGYLRVKNYRYSIVPSRLDPNEPREQSRNASSNRRRDDAVKQSASQKAKAEEKSTQ
ncbi:hypothetical protein AWZ03_013108 [Drosophila navojoa]|uniref:DUF4777 domain-containing protein n=2 Tax=Drosophila navojoa TaxID=7232 RepID=A0A484AXZ5_DRONA|nr:hypothetical protein AWZ03_013108 [Drosophila navojoa]